ncbi:unnamed protein product, partial [Brassica oleracea var. botrytis]
ASSSHYTISNIDGSSQCQLHDLQTGAAIINGGSRMSCSSRTLTHRCSQNPLIGFFKVDFDVCAFLRMQALGLQVKFLFGSLLSLATSIFHLVLVIFVYRLIVEDLSGCNRLSPLDL